ncbi:MAG: 4-hydroxy-tetrahydrodipicolinate synthase [Thermoguttaceae bacterium]|nr:4-hydroxy-tetrahydrodipicolinate synthase [Thermoguttaceae bacterium]
MKTRAEEYAGLSIAMVTPFKDDKVDYDALERNTEFLIRSGVTCLVPVGTTGESPTLTHEEHEKVITTVVRAAAGRCKVMPGTGSNCTHEALRLTRWAEDTGADAALVVAPYYNKPTQEGFYQHFKAVAEAVSIPICVYNIPGRAAKNIKPETIIRLAELPNIKMVKEATGAMDQASRILAQTDLTVLSGDDSMTLPHMAVGAKGIISVVGNIVPQDMVALCNAMLANDLETARKWHFKTFQLCRDMLSLATNPIPVKAAMKLLGMDTGELRLPLTPLDEKQEASLIETLKRYGLL